MPKFDSGTTGETMYSRTLMVGSSIMLGAAGIAALFAPAEILPRLGGTADSFLIILVQLLGTVYFGFALMNWTAKENAIGGIYSRPLCFGNFAHFGVGSLVLLRPAFHHPGVAVLIALVVYAVFAIAFGSLLFSQGPVPRH